MEGVCEECLGGPPPPSGPPRPPRPLEHSLTTQLRSASQRGHSSCVKALISAGADVNSSCFLKDCVGGGFTECLKLLITAGADVNRRMEYRDEVTPLHWAAQRGQEECMDILLAAGADVNCPNEYFDETPVIFATQAGSAGCIEKLVKAGADVNIQGYRERSALYHAAFLDSDECLKMLIDSGANVNLQNPDGNNIALQIAIEVGSKACFELLLKAGADVNTGSYPPLLAAIEHNEPEFALMLLEAGADVNSSHLAGMVHAACERGYPSILKKLFDKGVHLTKSKLDCMLHLPITRGRVECLDLLIEKGADVNADEASSKHILRVGAFHGALLEEKHIQCVKYLLKAGTHINVTTEFTQNELEAVQNEDEKKKTIARLMTAAGETLEGTASVAWFHMCPELKKNELRLKHFCREAIRKQLLDLDRHSHLFDRIPNLHLPEQLTSYLLYNMSLD